MLKCCPSKHCTPNLFVRSSHCEQQNLAKFTPCVKAWNRSVLLPCHALGQKDLQSTSVGERQPLFKPFIPQVLFESIGTSVKVHEFWSKRYDGASERVLEQTGWGKLLLAISRLQMTWSCEAQTKAGNDVQKFKWEVSRSDGILTIQCLTKELVPSTAALLTDAFSEAMGYMPLYRRFLCRNIEQYLLAHMALIPTTVILVAVFHHASSARSSGEDDTQRSASDKNRPVTEATEAIVPQRLPSVVGTLELSFTRATRTHFLTLNAPADCAYLCNMAVDRAFQRQGFGKLLLQACERVVDMLDEKKIYLHLRLKDRAAAGLYKQAGYKAVAEDNPFIMLLGQDRRYLMLKEL